ncbi:prevent-host-death protein [Alteromonas mediterranea MED64]|nr:prevent-host-death protein [Alteromonas mediterranea MED64]
MFRYRHIIKILRSTRKSIRFIFRLSDYNKSIFRPIEIVMKTQTVSYMKEHANHLELDNPILVTQNGKPKYVIQDANDYEEQQQTIALLKLINLSERRARQNGLLDLDEAFDDD